MIRCGLLVTICCLFAASVRGADRSGFAWDAVAKSAPAKAGATNATLFFLATNVTAETVRILSVKPSCGCTTIGGDKLPRSVAAGEVTRLEFVTDLRGKTGTLRKTALVETDRGMQLLKMSLAITEPVGAELRERNRLVASRDRFAIFHGTCADCHVKPATGKHGAELYRAACGICHEAEHRADMVPDLRKVKGEQNEIYWRHWISRGKGGTLMPPFARINGGPLSSEQLESLVRYLAGPWRGGARPVGRTQ